MLLILAVHTLMVSDDRYYKCIKDCGRSKKGWYYGNNPLALASHASMEDKLWSK